MSEKVWIGAVYLNCEGGYEIVLKSLRHYKKRLQTLGSSPELKDAAAMFGSVLNQQAAKTIPQVVQTIRKIQDSLGDIGAVRNLEEDIPFLEKALMCYEADIDKARNTGHEYFARLVGDMAEATEDLKTVKLALGRIREYSE